MWLLWGQDFRALSVDKTKASPYIPPNALQGINIPRTSKELTAGLEETKSEEHPVQREHHLHATQGHRGIRTMASRDRRCAKGLGTGM